MPNRKVLCQILQEIADDLDKQGHHNIADSVTEDLIKVSSGNDNVREAFLGKLFKGFGGKKFWKPLGQALKSGVSGYIDQQKIYNQYLTQINTGQNLAELQRKIQMDNKLSKYYKDQLIGKILSKSPSARNITVSPADVNVSIPGNVTQPKPSTNLGNLAPTNYD